MDKKMETILLYKKDKYKTSLESFGSFFSVNIYLATLNLVLGNVGGFLFGAICSGLLFYFSYDMLKKYVPKYNRKWFHVNYQIMCLITFVMFFLLPVDKAQDWKFMVVDIAVCFLINQVFVYSFNKKDVSDLFDEKQIKEWENELK